MRLRDILLYGLAVSNNSVLIFNVTGAISPILYFFRRFSPLTVYRLEKRGTCSRGGGQGQGQG